MGAIGLAILKMILDLGITHLVKLLERPKYEVQKDAPSTLPDNHVDLPDVVVKYDGLLY